MRGYFFLIFLLLTPPVHVEVIDRVAASAGNRVITHSDILREIRLSAFMNRTKPDFSLDARKKAAERLVERVLIENEMELGKYAAPQLSDIESELSALKRGDFPTADSYGIRDEDLKLYLLQQVAVVRFIDARFGPAVQLLESDMRDYYSEHIVRQWDNKSGKPAPAFDEVREQIGEVLRAERANALVAEWLKEVKARTRIDFRPEAFQ